MYNQGNMRLHVDLFIKYVSNNVYSDNNHGHPHCKVISQNFFVKMHRKRKINYMALILFCTYMDILCNNYDFM